MIIDEDLEVVRNSFNGFTLIHGLPIMPDLASILDFVGEAYFEPPIENIAAYEFADKAGVGLPYAIPRTTTLGRIKRKQKHRRVGLDRLSICGKADLSMWQQRLYQALTSMLQQTCTFTVLFNELLTLSHQGPITLRFGATVVFPFPLLQH